MRKSVIIVSPDKHLGGLSSNGLGFTDTGNKSTIGGIAREFYHRVYKHYQQPSAWPWQDPDDYGNIGQGTPAMDGRERTMWVFEPHVAEQIFEDFINEYQIPVYRNEWLDRKSGVSKNAGSITSIRTLSGKKFLGKMFIDATYEGDLMAAAGVSYQVGREASKVYNEEWNGVQVGVLHHGHYFKKASARTKYRESRPVAYYLAYPPFRPAGVAMATNASRPIASAFVLPRKRKPRGLYQTTGIRCLAV
ncbi:FAD-dependent oxidoreductase [Chitinophaga sedimenti]|nr:FAD-dependent oxidoreductase [Chitinophaga sedimenti]